MVQDKNEVKLGDVTFIMEDPESIAQISGILWYKIFPNDKKRKAKLAKDYNKLAREVKKEKDVPTKKKKTKSLVW